MKSRLNRKRFFLVNDIVNVRILSGHFIFYIIKFMKIIKQNIENLRYSIQWHSFDLTRDQQDALLLLLETLEQQLKQYESLNKKGI